MSPSLEWPHEPREGGLTLISQELLQNLGSQATRPRISRDLRHDVVEGLAGPLAATVTDACNPSSFQK